jgi:hypothetical protein
LVGQLLTPTLKRMFTSPTFTIEIALLVAIGLVGFGIIRLVMLFHEEFHRDNSLKDASYPLDTADKKQ